MSAIAGIFHLDGQPVDISAPERMIDCLQHRGADSSGLWREGQVAFAHRLLFTTPESLYEKLPMVNETGDLVITADARIDNRDELLQQLDLDSNGAADSRIILAAYEKWGESCAEKLLGDFAFAIWDRRNQVLFCARDPIGVKPFYYYLSDRLFVFASEIKALFCLSDVPCRLNNSKVAEHINSLFEDKTSTLYQEILRLPPAHSLTVSNRTKRFHRYWSLDSQKEIRLKSDQEYTEAFRDLFGSAVQCRLRSAFPVGSSLSGGLDSSSVACTAKTLIDDLETNPLHTFSAIFPDLPEEDMSKIDERRYIQSVLALGGFEPHFVRADRLSPLSNIDEMLWHQDEAFLAPNLYIHWGLYRSANQSGVRIFLDGLDGDSTVSHGLDYLVELARKGKWFKLHKEASALSRQSPNRSFTPGSVFWHYGVRNLIPERAATIWRRLRGNSRATGEEISLIDKSFSETLAGNDQPVGKQKKWHTTRESHCASLDSPQIPYSLELADKAGAAFGLEPRYPFFDRRLMEFCVALPAEQKLNQGWTRIVMRRAMEGILPKEVQWRIGKANLSPNFKRGLLDRDQYPITRAMSAESEVAGKYYDAERLRAAHKRFASTSLPADQDALTLFAATVLDCWLRSSAFGRAKGNAFIAERHGAETLYV